MAPVSTALTTKVESGSPYQLSTEQTLKASNALLAHIKNAPTPEVVGKKSLITTADSEADSDSDDSPVIWLNFTTKKHIVDQKRLKPTKVSLPHSLNSSENTTICLITADPQRTYKDIVASPAFPAELSKRITKVVGLDKLKKKYSQYEAQRKLYSEHDIFLADDRIVAFLPKALGKVFYKNTAKRPVPVSIQAAASREDGKRVVRAKGAEKTGAATPQAIAVEIEKALNSALLHLSPSVSTAVRIGNASMTAEQLAENVEAVAKHIIEKVIPKQWRNVKSIYIKGEKTIALPIWLADELWTDEKEVLDAETAETLRIERANVGKKRKTIEAAPTESEAKVNKINKKQKVLVESNDDTLDKEIALRKEKLKKQKAEAAGDVQDEVPKPSKKSKRGKAIVA